MTIKISLDMENTLAATQHAFLQQYNEEYGTNYTLFDVDSWNWVRDEIDYDDFMQIVNGLWRISPSLISPTEVGLSDTVARLADIGDVYIVTNRSGCRMGMEYWLKLMDIDAYEDLVITEQSKAVFDYDFYIDDKPGLYHDLDWPDSLFLVRRPYNYGLWYKDDLTSIGSVREAVITLQDPEHHD